MESNSLIQWLGSIIAGGGIGAALTYIATFTSNKRKAAAEAEKQEEIAKQASIESESKLENLKRDRYEAMYNQINKMIQDYNKLSDEFRDFRKQASAQEQSFALKAQEYYEQLLQVQKKVIILTNISCYVDDCPNRIKSDPKK